MLRRVHNVCIPRHQSMMRPYRKEGGGAGEKEGKQHSLGEGCTVLASGRPSHQLCSGSFRQSTAPPQTPDAPPTVSSSWFSSLLPSCLLVDATSDARTSIAGGRAEMSFYKAPTKQCMSSDYRFFSCCKQDSSGNPRFPSSGGSPARAVSKH